MPDVSLLLSNGKTYSQKGRVDAVSGIVDAQTGAVSLRAVFPNEGHLLRNGGTGAVVVSTVREDVIVIPQPINASKPETTPNTLGSENISFLISVERDSSLPEALETIKPVAVDINNAGTCDTKPSPTVNIVYVPKACCISICPNLRKMVR